MAATTTWFIDPKKGNDSWSGTTRKTPFQHHERLRQTIGGKPIRGTVEVHLMDDFDATNPICIDFDLAADATVTYVGDKPLQSLVRSKFSAVVPIDRINNQALEVEAPGVDWQADGLLNTSDDLPRGALRRITLPNSGAVAYACKQTRSANMARTSPFGLLTSSAPSTMRRVPPQIGEEFVVEAGFVRVDSLAVDLRVAPGGTPRPRLLFADLELNPGLGHGHYVRTLAPHQGGPPDVVFTGCGVGRLSVQQATKVGFDFCRLGGTRQTFQASLVHLGGCCCVGEVAALEGARVSAYADTLFQGNALRIQGFARLGEVAFFDSQGAGLLVEEHGTVRVEKFLPDSQGGQAVYGNGNATWGARVLAGGCMVYVPKGRISSPYGSGISATGNQGDVSVAGTPFSWSSGSDLVVPNKRAAVVQAA